MDDAQAIQKHINNWNIIRYINAPWPYPDGGAEEHLREVISEVNKGNQLSWALTLQTTKEFVGKIDYCFLGNSQARRGFWLAEPFHGQGYMTEAVTATQDCMFFDCMFFEYGLEKITVSNLKGNDGSIRVKEKTGAQFIGEKSEIVREKNVS